MHGKRTSLLTVAAVALGVSLLAQAFGPRATTAPAPVAKEPIFARVMHDNTLRCGYVLYGNFVMKDPNSGKMTGVFVDLTEKIGAMAGWKIEWTTETSFASMQTDMENGKYDVYCGGAWPIFPVAKFKSNSIAAFYSPIMAYVRAGDARFAEPFDQTQLNDPNLRIAEIDGELSQIARQQDFPLAKTLQLPQFTQISELALSVASGKADATILERAVANDYLAHNPGSLRDISHGRPLRLFANTWEFPNGEVTLRHTFDRAIADMLQSGAVEKILRQYEQTPGTFFRVAPPYQPQP